MRAQPDLGPQPLWALLAPHFKRRNALAKALGLKPPTVQEWLQGKRPIPDVRAAEIERLTAGKVTVDLLRPDLKWERTHDPEWPRREGRPVLSLSRRVVSSMPPMVPGPLSTGFREIRNRSESGSECEPKAVAGSVVLDWEDAAALATEVALEYARANAKESEPSRLGSDVAVVVRAALAGLGYASVSRGVQGA